ncbi:MAG: YaiI/YqxD family protein [Myxococcales bacterium]|nr:YaiI/YqxD family protein [Myxococcales bacterium]
MLDIYIDAEFCAIQNEVYGIARRFGLTVHVVSVRPVEVPRDERIRLVVLPDAAAADQWIVEHIRPDDIAVTLSGELAARLMEKGVRVLGSNGEIFGAECRAKIRAAAGPERDEAEAGLPAEGRPSAGSEVFYFTSQLIRIIQAIRATSNRFDS